MEPDHDVGVTAVRHGHVEVVSRRLRGQLGIPLPALSITKFSGRFVATRDEQLLVVLASWPSMWRQHEIFVNNDGVSNAEKGAVVGEGAAGVAVNAESPVVQQEALIVPVQNHLGRRDRGWVVGVGVRTWYGSGSWKRGCQDSRYLEPHPMAVVSL